MLEESLSEEKDNRKQLTEVVDILKEKIMFSENYAEHQGLLFRLKLKERSLLLRELSNQINVLRSEAIKKEHIYQTQQTRVVPALSVPLEQQHVVHRSDASLRPPSAPGLSSPEWVSIS